MKNDSITINIEWDVLPVDAPKTEINLLLERLMIAYIPDYDLHHQLCVWHTILRITDFSLERKPFNKFLQMLKAEPNVLPDKEIYWNEK